MNHSILECKSCGSSNLIELVGEICLQFPGLKGLKVEPIFVFPISVVCLDCGFMQSKLSWKELEDIRKGAAIHGEAT
jgi:hypothetical protein